MRDFLIQVCATIVSTLIICISNKLIKIIKKDLHSFFYILVFVIAFYFYLIYSIYILKNLLTLEITFKNAIYLLSLSISICAIINLIDFFNSLLRSIFSKNKSNKYKK